MADDTPQQDRTEAATPRRLQRAREEGHVAISREVQLLAGLAVAGLALARTGGSIASTLNARLATFLEHADASALAGRDGLWLAIAASLHGAAPFVLAAMIGGAGAALLQTGFAIRPGGVAADLGRLSPGAGLRRLVGPDNLVEVLKSLAKIAVMALTLWRVVQADLPALIRTPLLPPSLLPQSLLPPVLHMLFAVLAVQAAIAALDLLWVRQRHARGLRMSREDIREEQRETEGDPRLKARIRQIRMQRARKRMLAAVPKATVVVTNPTHYAVALAYDRAKTAAPRVVAKGVDSLAVRIREAAQAHRVPLVANPPLARALYRIEVDTEIPAEHYQAVAEIIAYVWRLGQRARAAGRAA